MSLGKQEDRYAEEAPQARRDRREAAAGRCTGLAGAIIADAICSIGMTGVSYDRWRREFGGLKSDQVKLMKELEAENARLRRAIADQTLDKLILKEAASGNWWTSRIAVPPNAGSRADATMRRN